MVSPHPDPPHKGGGSNRYHGTEVRLTTILA